MSKFYGKYRAKVVNNKDPENMGRIQVQCPSVLGDYTSNWCVPCSPIACDFGGIISVPSVNEIVWIEFEEGETSKPIYVGGWWIPNKTPFKASVKEGEIVISNSSGASITLPKSGTTIKVNGNLSVSGKVSATNI